MKPKFNRWDIAKIVKPSKSVATYVQKDEVWCVAGTRKNYGAFDQIIVDSRMIGKTVIVNYMSRNTRCKYNIYNVREKLALNSKGYVPTASIPEEMLEPTGKRALDVRSLDIITQSTAFKWLSTNTNFNHTKNRTSSDKTFNEKSITTLRKSANVFFPSKKYSIKKIMFELMDVLNCESADNLMCPNCGWCHGKNYVSSKRYFRKNDGGTTFKCTQCDKVSFIVLDFCGRSNGRFVLSNTNEHKEYK